MAEVFFSPRPHRLWQKWTGGGRHEEAAAVDNIQREREARCAANAHIARVSRQGDGSAAALGAAHRLRGAVCGAHWPQAADAGELKRAARDAGAVAGARRGLHLGVFRGRRAASGEQDWGDSLSEAYVAVFGGESKAQEVSGNLIGMTVSEQDVSDLTSARELPALAVGEQRILGFSYTTPLSGTVTSPFGWRDDPNGAGECFHYGMDIAGEEGASVAWLCRRAPSARWGRAISSATM